MKLLRNPIVTGLLVVAAVLTVFYQIYGPRWQRARESARQPVAAAVAAVARALAPPPSPAPVVQSAEKEAPTDVVPDVRIDRDFAKAHFDTWVESPARDPFLLLGPQPVEVINNDSETNSPIRKMKLKGIWDQTGSRVAVIDRDVYRQGDEIEGYKLIEIGIDEVWFQGPTRKERLGLEKRQPAIFFPPQTVPSTTPHS
jgi:hypothetical protein